MSAMPLTALFPFSRRDPQSAFPSRTSAPQSRRRRSLSFPSGEAHRSFARAQALQSGRYQSCPRRSVPRPMLRARCGLRPSLTRLPPMSGAFARIRRAFLCCTAPPCTRIRALSTYMRVNTYPCSPQSVHTRERPPPRAVSTHAATWQTPAAPLRSARGCRVRTASADAPPL